MTALRLARLSTVVRCRYQCSTAAALSGADTSQVRHNERVGVDRPRAGQLIERQGPLVWVEGPAAP